VQVQRCSGSAILSARRQARAPPGSPLAHDRTVAALDMAAADGGGDGRSDAGAGSGPGGEGEQGDADDLADDEEFAVEEQAHRCGACRAGISSTHCIQALGHAYTVSARLWTPVGAPVAEPMTARAAAHAGGRARVPERAARAVRPDAHPGAARRAEQARQAGRLDELQRTLEAKEAEMARLAGGNGIGRVDHLKAHYDEALAALASERNALQKERGQLVQARGPRFRVRARLRASSMCPGRAWAAGARARLRSRACMPVHAVMECPTISGWATAGSKGARAAATVQGSASLGSGAANLVTCPWPAQCTCVNL